MTRFLAALLCVAALALAATSAAPARADVFGSISLVSKSTVFGFAGRQQADYAHDPAISGDGRYVAFDGSFCGSTGVWRRDLGSGVVEPVAVGEPETPAGSAELPSISDDGRYVSFTTTAALDPLDDANVGPDVYVRDMSVPAGQPCEPGAPTAQTGAFTLASAIDGGTTGLSYEPSGREDVEFEESHYGSLASGRSALSADGRRVVFVTTAISDLDGPGTPVLQVALRDLDTDSTQLVSVKRDSPSDQPEPVAGIEGSVAYGAVFSPNGNPPAYGQTAAYAPPPMVGASISADGSTVAWMGVDVPEQASLLAGETQTPRYAEPLWRRVADGPQARTRRITGGSDPANPACIASGESVLPGAASASDPCQGPFATTRTGALGVWAGGEGEVVPRLSADGYAVAFLANAPLVAFGSSFGQGADSGHADLYLADMHEGLTRDQALRPLTELASGDNTDLATTAPVLDLGISRDGSQVAFTTKRTVFPLGSPAYVSPPAGAAGMVELFDIDRSNDTLTRVTQGFEGGPSEHPHAPSPPNVEPYKTTADGALSPSFSDDGGTIAFSSTASNLVYGDGNTPPNTGSLTFDGSDAFAVSRVLFGSTPTPQFVSSPPASPTIVPLWRLGITARSRRDGSVLLNVSVPGAGKLQALAKSALLLRTKARRGRAGVRAKSVASASKGERAAAGGLLAVPLKLGKDFIALASKRGGLSATVGVTFAAAGHRTLRQSIVVSFRRTAKATRHAAKGARHRGAQKATVERAGGGGGERR